MYGRTIRKFSPSQLKSSKRTANAMMGAATSEAASSRRRCRFLIRLGRNVISGVNCWLAFCLSGFGKLIGAQQRAYGKRLGNKNSATAQKGLGAHRPVQI